MVLVFKMKRAGKENGFKIIALGFFEVQAGFFALEEPNKVGAVA